MIDLTENKIKQIQDRLIDWYRQYHRKLPFRETKEPYHIWISEIMLQQTQVATVIDYYNNFIKQFPTIRELANSRDEDVLKSWEGLGYYSRVRNLHKAAKTIVEKYDGVFPSEYEQILALPGIGDYTAGAIYSIAYGKAVPAIDGNVLRVYSRLFLIEEDITQSKIKKAFHQLGQQLVSTVDPSSFNQGVMELGALVCTPDSPKCGACPLIDNCLAKEKNRQGDFPVKKKKKPQKHHLMEVALVIYEQKIVLVKRPSTGVLAHFWGLPIAEKQTGLEDGLTIHRLVEADFNLKITEHTFILEKEHVFTHQKWQMKLYAMSIERNGELEADSVDWKWVTVEELETIALPVAFKKLLTGKVKELIFQSRVV